MQMFKAPSSVFLNDWGLVCELQSELTPLTAERAFGTIMLRVMSVIIQRKDCCLIDTSKSSIIGSWKMKIYSAVYFMYVQDP